MKLCIAGAGAIGCTLAALLAKAGNTVNVLARGATLDALQTNGISLKDLQGQHRVNVVAKQNAAEFGVQDVIFVCTKTTALEVIAESIQPMIGEHTIIVPMINGLPWWYFQGIDNPTHQVIERLDPTGKLAKLLPAKHLIGCVTFMTAFRKAPGDVVSENPHLLILGEIHNELTERLQQLRAVLEAAEIEARAVDNIRDQIWTKVAANLTSNPLSVITKGTLNQLYADPRLSPLVRHILDEVLLTAAAYSARIRFNPLQIMEMGAGMGNIKTSMLQDFTAGQPLELDAIGYSVIELAGKVGIEMPRTKQVLDMAAFISEQDLASRA
ncbi:ketopantoate reductase family protein [Vibrio porteresiae]|uniref:2-dehydropantoate 2-reductase n=1 Tax=Vibrio porteresiae DSM 19223 TaxID=1123496 RepID=A0ABZ0QCZ2_9VIBR|nr:2-dehydropantoate 2-reductase [Vibrio porteresiae]WPC73430.1 2-dehydropantoate 2-reductase [Vibrio porteresiae DSM 19223]